MYVDILTGGNLSKIYLANKDLLYWSVIHPEVGDRVKVLLTRIIHVFEFNS